MSWANTTVTTVSNALIWEHELTDLFSAAISSYLAEAVDIADGADPIVTGISSLNVQDAKGHLLIIGVVNEALTIKDGKDLGILIKDSTDDSTYEEIHAGQRLFYRATSGADISIAVDTVLFKWIVPPDAEDYVKAYISSDATNEGKIDIYSVSILDEKLSKCKDLLQMEIERNLANKSYTCDYGSGEVLVDIVYDPTQFKIPLEFLFLAHVFRDLAGSDDKSDFWIKYRHYIEQYEIRFKQVMSRLHTDLDQDGTVDKYDQKTRKMGTNFR